MVIICVSDTNGSSTVQKEKEIKTNEIKSLMDDIVCATAVTCPPNSSCGEASSLSTDLCNVINKADHSAVKARNKNTGVVVGGGAGSLCHSRQLSTSFVLHLPTTPLNWSVISSSTFRFTRDPPSHQQTQDLYGTMVTASDVDSSTRGGTGRRSMLACYSGAHIKDVTTTISFKIKSNCSTSDNDSDDQSAMYKTIPFNKLYVDPIAQYKRNWGISTICRLLGGGETTLASGNGTATAGWGNPGTTPVPASVTGTSNWNTSPLVDGQSPPSAVSNGPWQQSPQSSSTSSNNTSQTSNIGNKGQNSNSGSSSSNGTLSTSQATNNQQNTTSWAQAAGKNLPASSGPQVSVNTSVTTTTSSTTSGLASNPQSSSNSPPTNSGNGVANSSTKQQLEQINTMREALYAQDGWGGQHVNQDSQWDVPHSPEPNTKDGPLTGLTGGPGWNKVNNGTDLWEATLRNGGQPPLQIPVQNTSKTPWGHTPASNIGGTWGEDDDVSSVSGVEGNTGNWGINPTTSMGNQWGQGQPPPQGPGGPMWGGPPKKDIGPEGQSWNSGNNAWNDLNRPPGSIDQGPHRRDILPNGIVDHSRGIGNDARGGISGRLNGTLSGGGAGMEPMWGGPPPHHMQHHVQPPSVGPPPSVIATPGAKLGQGPVPVINQWSGPPPPPKDLNPMNNNHKGNGWEEPSPTDHRRNLLNYDDGTSLWGNSQTRPNVPGGGGLLSTQHNMNKHWGKADMAAAVAAAAAGRNNNSGNMGNQCPPGVPPNRPGMPPTKMVDQQLWQGNPRNGTWGDVSGGSQHDLNVGGPWGEDKMGNAGGPWPNSEWGPGPKSKNSWGDCSNNDMDPSSWGQKNIGQKNQNKDYIWQSKSYRILAEMGVKKEDVEAVTRSYNISMEDAVEFLMSTRGPGGAGLDSWNSHGGRGQHPDDQNAFDRSNVNQQRFNSQQIPFAVPSIGNNSNQAMLQKLLAQQPPTQPNSMQQQYCQGGSRQMQNQPTTQQLRMLVQQIQMAVQAGYLNHQILNQPLAPQTLIMLNQLLQQIKILQQNVQIQAAVANNPKSGPAMVTAAIAINKARQQIASLQNQIANNQAMHMKAQAHQNQSNFAGLSGLMGGQGGGDFFKNDPLTLLQSGFSDLAMNKDSQISGQGFQTSQQSRLNQWKLPNLDKDDLGMGNDFSRAPGANSKSTPGNTSPSFNSLLSQGDGTWTNVGGRSDSGWPDNVEDNKEVWPNNGSNSQSNPTSSAFTTDLVPEFEPGKPWKGNQIKNIEDDPTITPGSVVRSPLSLAATIKDSNNSDIFNSGGKTSPTNSQTAVDMPLSLSSSTWSFNPPPSSQPSFTSPLGKTGGPKNNWTESNPGNDLWGGLGSSGKSRGPPPGLSGASNKTGNAPNNGWPRWPSSNTSSSWQSSSNNVASTWLLLRNLTQQIDGSTLKTLCIQHGPLLNFHMYLNHGIALAKYSTREEASKAQGALNNCVLGNTTIFAESPTDAEVQMLLTHLSGGGSNTNVNNSGLQQTNWNNGRNGNGGNSQGQQGSDAWANNQLWGGNNSGPPGNTSLWGAGADQIDPHRTTPSSLNSFMPGDLLGSETTM